VQEARVVVSNLKPLNWVAIFWETSGIREKWGNLCGAGKFEFVVWSTWV